MFRQGVNGRITYQLYLSDLLSRGYFMLGLLLHVIAMLICLLSV